MRNETESALATAFSGSFMQPEILRERYFTVETTYGTECVPASCVPCSHDTHASALRDYVEGKLVDPSEPVECKMGWIARLQAPGYMDATEWAAFSSFEEAANYLIDTYADNE